MNIRQQLARSAMAIVTVLALAACGSSVKLDDVPVSDAKSVAVTGAQGASTVQGNQAGATERAVQAVNVPGNALDGSGPAGVAKVFLFDYDSYVIKPEYQTALDAHARFLSADRKRKLAVEGHTDERGGREYNLALGQKRAEAVRRALALLGVQDAQVEAVSFGKEKPVDAASSEAAYAKNRRAELNYR